MGKMFFFSCFLFPFFSKLNYNLPKPFFKNQPPAHFVVCMAVEVKAEALELADFDDSDDELLALDVRLQLSMPVAVNGSGNFGEATS